MKHMNFYYLLVFLLTMSISPNPVSAQEIPLFSGMDAQVGQNGWYTSDVTIFIDGMDAFKDAVRNGPGVQLGKNGLRVVTEGRHEIIIPDGLGGAGIQFVNIDKHGPLVTWLSPSLDNELVRGETMLTISARDEISRPLEIQVSYDNGKTWETHPAIRPDVFQAATPEYIWSLEWDTTGLPIGKYTLLARAVDYAGNTGNTSSLTVIVKK